MPGYQYRGNRFDVVDEPAVRVEGFDPARCGTYANYRQHLQYRVAVCEDCREAFRAYERARWAAKRAQEAEAA